MFCVLACVVGVCRWLFVLVSVCTQLVCQFFWDRGRTMPVVEPACQVSEGGTLDVDRGLYDRISVTPGARRIVNSFVVPARSGRAWEVPAGHLCRIVTVDGPQVGDFNVWNRHDAGEYFWAARTRQLQRAHVSTYDRLWSCLPFLRPLLTVTRDTLAGFDGDGGRVHDLLGTHCDPCVSRLLAGRAVEDHCHGNLVRAIEPYGLTESDVHDALGVFHRTGLNQQDQYVARECPARPGDFFEFFAELDLLCALSTCPGGDMSVPMWGPYAHDAVEGCRPIAIVVYAVDDVLLEGWTPPPWRGARNPAGGVGLRAWLS
ncbi:DUF1989 domain-containing protein [Streptomyces sp. FIT100]|uniref:urea carboxylase-associated family protein n=1 Tax=Streptomyces sp. FIT100 TaxID=2837956 RepID=UPI0021C73B41|nr:DUF1989 domain-containing protein [Streptomyces sp. FIT100]